MVNNQQIENRVRSEIEELHRFFMEWFSGTVACNDLLFDTDFVQRFDEGFCLIPPGGTILDFSSLSRNIHSGHGSNPNFRIAIRNVRILRVWDQYVLAMYEEWQRNAIASSPPDNGRIVSVLFEIGNCLRWLHVHETWMPQSTMEAGPYDF